MELDSLRSRRIQAALAKKPRAATQAAGRAAAAPGSAIQGCLDVATAAAATGKGQFTMPGLLASRMEAMLGDERSDFVQVFLVKREVRFFAEQRPCLHASRLLM